MPSKDPPLEMTNDAQFLPDLWPCGTWNRAVCRVSRMEPEPCRSGAECSQIGSRQPGFLSFRVQLLPPLHRRQVMGVQLNNVVNAILYAAIGIVIFAGAFLVLDKVTPYNLWKEIVQEHNTALAILLGGMSLGICVIIAAAVH